MSRLVNLIAVLALLLAGVSLAVNLILLQRLEQGRVAVLGTLDSTSERLNSLADVSIRQSVHVQQTIPVTGSIPFHQTLTVPISMTIPFNDEINVNVNTPLGPMNMPVNFDTSVPVDMQFPVTISQTVPYSLTIPIDMQVPFEVRLRDLGIEAVIRQAQLEIQQLRSVLE